MKKLFLLLPASLFAFNLQKFIPSIAYEEWKLPHNEKMGVVKYSLDYPINEYFFLGSGMFGAIKGKRGGFFTFGFEGGVHLPLGQRVNIESSLFLGAGGGGSAAQGGGLMLRGALGANFNLDIVQIGVGVSKVRFVNGDISSSQIYTSLYFPLTWLPKDIDTINYFYFGHYFVKKDVKDTSGKKMQNLSFSGVQKEFFINKNSYLILSSAGASGGESDGYMEVMAGIGYKKVLFSLPFFIDVELKAGLGGGGKVDTGGGAIWSASAGFGAKIYKNFYAKADYGYLSSFNGTFKATFARASIGFKEILNNELLQKYRFRAINKVHFTKKGDFKDAIKNRKLYLLGLAIDRYISKNFYITGQALWAYKGKSGGYTEGLMGIGFKKQIFKNFYIRSEALLGAGGGGGVKTGGGMIGSVDAMIGYKLNKHLTIETGAGYTKAKSEGLSSKDLIFALQVAF